MPLFLLHRNEHGSVMVMLRWLEGKGNEMYGEMKTGSGKIVPDKAPGATKKK